MLNSYIYLLCLLALARLSLSIPKPEEVSHQRFSAQDAMHLHGIDTEHHNPQYDHEAFLGKDEADAFVQLPPEESKRRLKVIAEKIDENNDGFIVLSELKNWIQYTQRRYIDEDVMRAWNINNPENNSTISWEKYHQSIYGFMDDMNPTELENEDNGISYKNMLARDRRRWGVADTDLDDALTRIEFTAFLHPEDHPAMRDLVLTETIEDIDKNKDGKISIDEYIGDMYQFSDAEEPEWVKSERESFTKFRDTNGDGYLDREEVRAWIVPEDFDNAESEAKHLIFEADQNNDAQLTIHEILEKYDLFVGSQATDFGEALTRHDEF